MTKMTHCNECVHLRYLKADVPLCDKFLEDVNDEIGKNCRFFKKFKKKKEPRK